MHDIRHNNISEPTIGVRGRNSKVFVVAAQAYSYIKKNMKPGGNTDFEIHKTSLFGLMGSHTPGMTLPSLVQVQPATLLCNNDIGKSTRESRNDTGFKFSFH